MAVTLYSSGTLTTVVGVEHVLENLPTSGVYILEVDLGAMMNGDTIEARFYKSVLSGGASRLVSKSTFVGLQDEANLIQVSIPISTSYGAVDALKWTIKQTTGSPRAIPWALIRHA